MPPLSAPATAWLVPDSGPARAVEADGLSIGRNLSCDLVLSDERVSNHHAHLQRTASGLEFHVLGRRPTRVDGEVITGVVHLDDGAVIEFPGARFTVHIDASEAGTQPMLWLVEAGGVFHRVGRRPVAIGGGPDQQLRFEGWPPEALVLYSAAGSLFVEAACPGVTLDGDPLLPEDLRVAGNGAVLAWREDSVRVAGTPVGDTTPTEPDDSANSEDSITFTYLPSGAELRLRVGGSVVTCRLSEYRARLVAVLLQPGGAHQPGEFVDDEWVLRRVWPREQERTNLDLNTLLHRVRRDLVKAGLDPRQLIERPRTGGATRWLLGPDTAVEIC